MREHATIQNSAISVGPGSQIYDSVNANTEDPCCISVLDVVSPYRTHDLVYEDAAVPSREIRVGISAFSFSSRQFSGFCGFHHFIELVKRNLSKLQSSSHYYSATDSRVHCFGDQGNVLVLDMGTPVSILDLARTLIQLSGKKEEEVEIAFTGVRPGEKLFEELFYPEEVVRDTSCPKIKKARNVLCGWGELEAQLDNLRATLYVDGASPIRAKIKQIFLSTPTAPKGLLLAGRKRGTAEVGNGSLTAAVQASEIHPQAASRTLRHLFPLNSR